jgi:endonuclease YncB( thermonuclease family)
MLFHRNNIRIILAVVLNTALLIGTLHAQTITGKVVGVADGDTITVLQNQTQYKIRLYGIDTPEKGQDFGKRAKQFTSDLVFGKQVRVVQKDVDRYSRVVGMVFIGNVCVNQEIIRAGLGWTYNRYCKADICREWVSMEAKAKIKKTGLWAHSDPIPPWDYRRGTRSTSKTQAELGGAYHGNTGSMVFHQPGCRHFNCKNCTQAFESRAAAIQAGYRPCGMCKP